MILSTAFKKRGWVCCRCGEAKISESMAEEPEPGICPLNSTQTEEKPHTWRYCFVI